MEAVQRVSSVQEFNDLKDGAAPGVVYVAFVGLASLEEATDALFLTDEMSEQAGWILTNRDELQSVSDYSRRLQHRRQQMQKVRNNFIITEPEPTAEEEVGRLLEARLAAARARLDAKPARRSDAKADATRRSAATPIVIDYSAAPRFMVPGSKAASTSPRAHDSVVNLSSSRGRDHVIDTSTTAHAVAADSSSSRPHPVVVEPSSPRPSSAARATPPRQVRDRGSSSSSTRGPGTTPHGVPESGSSSSSLAPGQAPPPRAHARRAPTLKEARAVHAAARQLVRRADRAAGFREITDRLLAKMDRKLNERVVVRDLCNELRDMEEMFPARAAHYAATCKFMASRAAI